MRTISLSGSAAAVGVLAFVVASGCANDGSRQDATQYGVGTAESGLTDDDSSAKDPLPQDATADPSSCVAPTCNIAEPTNADCAGPAVLNATKRYRSPTNGHWYQRFDSSLSWHEAVHFCRALGGYLATITDATENQFIWDTLGAGSPQAMWLGATDEGSEGQWTWVTGEPFTWSHWADGEPNNVCRGEDYMQLIPSIYPTQSYWVDVDTGIGVDGTGGSCGCSGCTDLGLVSTLCEWNRLPHHWTSHRCRSGNGHPRECGYGPGSRHHKGGNPLNW